MHAQYCTCNCHTSVIQPVECYCKCNNTYNKHMNSLLNLPNGLGNGEGVTIQILNLNTRIRELQESFHKVNKEIEELGYSYSGLKHEYDYLEERINKLTKTKPHKCPACEGWGFMWLQNIADKPSDKMTCPGCEGKGVLWSGQNGRS